MSIINHTYRTVTPNSKEDKILLYSLFKNSLPIEIDNQKIFLPEKYLEECNNYDNFKIKNSDIIVVTYPKSGTTWMQEMVWMIKNKLDFEGEKVKLDERFPFLEISLLFNKNNLGNKEIPAYLTNSLTYASQQKNPRFIKTHLPWNLLPLDIKNNVKQPKIIYVARNPKDVCVSFYYHMRLINGYKGSLEDFVKYFLAEKVMYGSYWNHVIPFWQKRNEPNILFITYEKMKKDLSSVIKEIAEFLQTQLSNEQINILKDHLSFESMKKNPAVNNDDLIMLLNKMQGITESDGHFLRLGEVMGYKKDLSPQIIADFDVWIKENQKKFNFYCSELQI